MRLPVFVLTERTAILRRVASAARLVRLSAAVPTALRIMHTLLIMICIIIFHKKSKIMEMTHDTLYYLWYTFQHEFYSDNNFVNIFNFFMKSI